MIKYKVKDAAADLGVSNKEIAAKLFLSEGTLRCYKENNDNTRGKRTRCDF